MVELGRQIDYVRRCTYLFPVDNVKLAVPQYSDVTRAEPPVVESGLGSFRVVEVALCHERTAYEQFAFLSWFDVVEVFVDHSTIHPRQPGPTRSPPHARGCPNHS